jgi:predicted amidophosphoribosyltransferase
MYCIYCDAEIPNTALYCTSCGRQFDRVLKTPVITCSACRVDNPNDAVFCWNWRNSRV